MNAFRTAVLLAVGLAASVASSAVAGDPCGDPAAGDCLAPNGTPGCDDATCCTLVCNLDTFCCDVEWDLTCVDIAVENCDFGGGGDSCGDPASGDCLVANGTPGCNDAACCELVCGLDEFCCSKAWDQACADAAASNCDAGCEGGALLNDCCEDAFAVGEVSLGFSTIGATNSGPELPGECDEGFGTGFGPDIWYAITPTEATGVIVSTCNQADYDTRLAAYAGCGGALVACNDDGEGCEEFSSLMTFGASAGETYLIRVGGYGTATGSGTLTISFGEVPPPYPTDITPQWTTDEGGNGHYYANIRVPEDSTFATVSATVSEFGGALATATSAEEMAFIRDAVRVAEPGQYDRCAFGLLQDAAGPEPAGGWYWASGEPLVYTNWRGGEPNDNPAPEDFGEFYPDGTWNDCFDADFGQVLVEWESDPGLADGVVWEIADGGNGHRYQAMIVFPEVDWATARQLAEDAGGRLATFETDDELAWVFDNLLVFSSLWEQPGDGTANGGPFVGLEQVDGVWQWITGEPLTTFPWYPGEPSGDGSVAHFFSNVGDGPQPTLNDLSADSAKRSFIIEFAGGGGSPCPADFDGDGVVGGSDFGILLTQWGACAGCPADLDGNGVVGGPDLGELLVQWGACP